MGSLGEGLGPRTYPCGAEGCLDGGQEREAQAWSMVQRGQVWRGGPVSEPGCHWEDSTLERLCLGSIAFGVCGCLHLCPWQSPFSLAGGGGGQHSKGKGLRDFGQGSPDTEREGGGREGDLA